MSAFDDEAATQAWIEAVLGVQFDASLSFQANLKDGAPFRRSFAFKQIDNIGMFLRGCEALGMPRADCFSANDLYQGDNMKKVLACLDSLGGLCQAKGVAVPAFGKNK
ncbi:hypothetical protein JL721_4110 [Aureococcus anophagefferens]|nr:hypothetical protein JL721_4110 [Aureococcus anophagefferens]